MAKFKVGDEVAVAAIMKIAAIQPQSNGTVSYSMDRGITIPEFLMEQIALSPKEQKVEEPKPAPKKFFSVGDRVETSIGHGKIVMVDSDSGLMPYLIQYDDGCKLWWKSATAKLETKPAPQPAHRFKVGDRVVTPLGHGEVVEVDDQSESKQYRIKYDDGCRFWYKGAMAKPEPAPEPPKFYTGKVFCSGTRFSDAYGYEEIVGRVLNINNGNAEWMCFNSHYTSFDDFCERNSNGIWHEVKEPSDV